MESVKKSSAYLNQVIFVLGNLVNSYTLVERVGFQIYMYAIMKKKTKEMYKTDGEFSAKEKPKVDATGAIRRDANENLRNAKSRLMGSSTKAVQERGGVEVIFR